MSLRIRDNWILKSFKSEFGFSDVQGNYSRLYAWMANQLGHMTIGLSTALVFFWVAESAEVAAKLFYAGLHPEGASTAPLGLNTGTAWLVRFVAALAILVTVLTANAAWLSPAKPPIPGGVRDHLPVPHGVRRLLGAIFTVAGGVALLWMAGDMLAAPPTTEGVGEAAARIGLLTATLLVGGIVLMLCEDAAFLALAAISLVAVFLLASGGAGLQPDTLQTMLYVLIAVFSAVAFFSLVLPVIPAPKLYAVERIWQLIVIVGLAVWFCATAAKGLSDSWGVAIGASIASVTLWWVKEFGADLPKVYREAAEAKARRPVDVTGAGAALEKAYLDDARIDSRTDGMFYFSGAWIGAGVLSDEPLFAASGWASGVEILGLLVFIAILYFFGEVWANRQNALDKIGVARASRLAVFASALKIGAAPRLGQALAPEPDPISLLGDFARGDGDRAKMFDHLILFGRPGSDVSGLGRAVASEAALSSLGTVYGQARRNRRNAKPRTGRFIERNTLIDQSAEILERKDLVSTPTIPFWAPNEEGLPVVGGDQPKPDGDYERLEPASVVVITDLIEAGPYTAADILANLSVAAGQQTVWLVQPTDPLAANPAGLQHDEAAAWAPDYERIRPIVDEVSAALSIAQSGVKVGVGFVARMRPIG